MGETPETKARDGASSAKPAKFNDRHRDGVGVNRTTALLFSIHAILYYARRERDARGNLVAASKFLVVWRGAGRHSAASAFCNFDRFGRRASIGSDPFCTDVEHENAVCVYERVKPAVHFVFAERAKDMFVPDRSHADHDQKAHTLAA